MKMKKQDLQASGNIAGRRHSKSSWPWGKIVHGILRLTQRQCARNRGSQRKSSRRQGREAMGKMVMVQGFVRTSVYLGVKYKDMIWPTFIWITAGSMANSALCVGLLFQHSADILTDEEKVNWRVYRGLLLLINSRPRTSQNTPRNTGLGKRKENQVCVSTRMSIIGTDGQAAQPVREYCSYPWKEIVVWVMLVAGVRFWIYFVQGAFWYTDGLNEGF